MQSFELLDDYELTGIDYEGNSITVPSQVFIQKDLPFITASFVYTDMSSLLSPASNKTQLISPVVSTILNCTTDSINALADIGNCVTANLTQPVIISFNLSGQQVKYTTLVIGSIFFVVAPLFLACYRYQRIWSLCVSFGTSFSMYTSLRTSCVQTAS